MGPLDFSKKSKNFGLRLSKILEFRGVALSCKHEAPDLAFRAVGFFSVLFGSPLLQRCARAGGAPHTPRSRNAHYLVPATKEVRALTVYRATNFPRLPSHLIAAAILCGVFSPSFKISREALPLDSLGKNRKAAAPRERAAFPEIIKRQLIP